MILPTGITIKAIKLEILESMVGFVFVQKFLSSLNMFKFRSVKIKLYL